MEGKSYKDLEVWKVAMSLVDEVYRLMRQLPKTERYGLAQQAQRSAVSIPSNIAEGHGRRRTGEFQYHLRVAHGSLCELETQLLLAYRLKYVDDLQLNQVSEQMRLVGKLLSGLLRYLDNQKQIDKA